MFYARVASDQRVGLLIFKYFFAGSTFSQRGTNVCLICEASLSHHTLYMGNLSPLIQCIKYFHVGQKKKKNGRKKRITALILKPTDDQKLETFLFAYKTFFNVQCLKPIAPTRNMNMFGLIC